MADPVVTLTNGVPTAGTGVITTLGQTLLDGANATIGATTDAKSTATDGTGVKAMSVWKQISFSIQALVTAFGAAWTRGAGASDANTQRVTIDSGQVGSLGAAASSASVPMVPATDWVGTTALSKFGTGYYVTVAASQTATVLQSSAGATGDYASGVLVIPATTSPGNVLLLDNATSITIFTGGASSVTNLVPFFIPLGAVSRSGAWKLTTGANVSCIAIGKFS